MTIPYQQGMHYGDWLAAQRRRQMLGQGVPQALPPAGPVPFQRGMHYGDWMAGQRRRASANGWPSTPEERAEYEQFRAEQRERMKADAQRYREALESGAPPIVADNPLGRTLASLPFSARINAVYQRPLANPGLERMRAVADDVLMGGSAQRRVPIGYSPLQNYPTSGVLSDAEQAELKRQEYDDFRRSIIDNTHARVKAMLEAQGVKQPAIGGPRGEYTTGPLSGMPAGTTGRSKLQIRTLPNGMVEISGLPREPTLTPEQIERGQALRREREQLRKDIQTIGAARLWGHSPRTNPLVRAAMERQGLLGSNTQATSGPGPVPESGKQATSGAFGSQVTPPIGITGKANAISDQWKQHAAKNAGFYNTIGIKDIEKATLSQIESAIKKLPITSAMSKDEEAALQQAIRWKMEQSGQRPSAALKAFLEGGQKGYNEYWNERWGWANSTLGMPW